MKILFRNAQPFRMRLIQENVPAIPVYQIHGIGRRFYEGEVRIDFPCVPGVSPIFIAHCILEHFFVVSVHISRFDFI
jgi:hypothetical protein